MRLLANSEIGRLFHLAADDDGEGNWDDDEEIIGFNNNVWSRRRRMVKPDPHRFPKVPSDMGTELMSGGIFGSNEAYSIKTGDTNNVIRKKLARRILDRELATETYAMQRVNQRLMAQVPLVTCCLHESPAYI
jgi:WD repeat-containing protein 23